MGDVGVYPESMQEDWRKSTSGDFVSRQWLLTEYDKRHNGPPGAARQMIEEAPPADVRAVKRGEWIGEVCSHWRHAVWRAYPVNRVRYKCSLCGRIENQKEPFCNCGADMTGGTDG